MGWRSWALHAQQHWAASGWGLVKRLLTGMSGWKSSSSAIPSLSLGVPHPWTLKGHGHPYVDSPFLGILPCSTACGSVLPHVRAPPYPWELAHGYLPPGISLVDVFQALHGWALAPMELHLCLHLSMLPTAPPSSPELA